MDRKLIVIKLGGAVITYKDSPTPKPRLEVINRLSQELKYLLDQNYQLILVHGAGSFAHGLVKKYGLDKGMETAEERKAFELAQKRMLQLNKIILDSLKQVKLSPVSLPPHQFVSQAKGKLKSFDLKQVKEVLKKDFTPVLFGDMVSDTAWGCSVLSGDTIVCFLANKLKASKVIFLTDVEGIYTADPKTNPHAKLIPEVNNKNLKSVLKGLSATGRDDVTGEMAGKLREIASKLQGQPVVLVSGLQAGNLVKALGQSQIGTKLDL